MRAETGAFGSAVIGGQIASQAGELVALIFVVIVGTVAFYGLLAAPLACRLGLAVKSPRGVLFVGAEPWVIEVAHALAQEGHPVVLLDTNYRNVANAERTHFRIS